MDIIMVRAFCLSTSGRSQECLLKVELKVELIVATGEQIARIYNLFVEDGKLGCF